MAIIEENYVHFAEHPETILSSLHQLYTCNMFIDMCLVCHGCEIFAHKVIIAAASPLLRDKINEFGDCHARIELEHTVNGVDINIEDIKLLVEFIYKGQVCVPETRLSLFLEVGNHFQVFGLHRQTSNFGSPLSFLSQPSSNYNISQHPLPNLNLGGLQQYQENINFEDSYTAQNDILGPNFPNFFTTNCLMSPEKLSDNLIKQDKSMSAPISNTSFSDLCTGNATLDPYHLLREKNLISDSSNPKQNCTFQNFTNDTSMQDANELSIISNPSYPSDLSESSANVQSENSKDVFCNEAVLPTSGLPDPNSFFHNISAEANSYFSTDNLVQSNINENCIEDITFQPCKIPASSSLPERQMRLKVKDSIGGVSLQDTSQGEKGLLRVLPESEELSIATDACQPIQDQVIDEIQEDSLETIEIELDHPCSQCHRRFYSQDDLTNHLYEEHNIGTLHKCMVCSFKTLIESCLVEHGKTHLGGVDRQCCICGKRFKTRATLRNHLACHASNKWFKCKECNAHYSQRNNLVKHLASEHRLDMEGAPIKEPISCSLCSFVTWAPHKLKNHKIRCHTVDKPYKCSECPYAATERTSLVKHIRTHTQERPYICDFCGLSFVTVSSLKRHCRGHTKEKPFQCNECGQQYADKKRLKDHLLKHKSIKPFKCNFCEYLCRRKDNLQSHIKRNHSNSTVEEVIIEDAQETLI